MNKSNIGIIGSGVVAQSLGAGFLKYGHDVKVGTRSPEKLNEWNSTSGKGALIGSFAEAADFGDIIVLAVKGSAAINALELSVAGNLKGKTIIDTTNPIADAAPENGVLKFYTNFDRSLMEDLQTAYPDAHFVKAFNSIGSPFMVNPDFGDSKPSMFICGNDKNAKHQVAQILDQFGFETEDMGMAEAARAIEPLCMLWCIPGFLENRWNHAFKLLKK